VAALATRAPSRDVAETSLSRTALHRSVTRALLALELVAESSTPLPLTTLAARLKTPKSSLHAVLKALVARRYLEVEKNGSYRLGLRAAELGAAYLNRVTPLKVAHPELVTLSRELKMTAHYAIVDGLDALYLAKEDAPGVGIMLASAAGTRLPADLTAVGKANLAFGTVPAAEAKPGLAAELALVRSQGYAVDEGRILSAVRCIAAPVFDSSGECCGAIGVSYLREGGPPVDEVATRVRQAAARASHQLGAPTAGQ
jgi:DNA-binding IclR family transcriptional regulator